MEKEITLRRSSRPTKPRYNEIAYASSHESSSNSEFDDQNDNDSFISSGSESMSSYDADGTMRRRRRKGNYIKNNKNTEDSMGDEDDDMVDSHGKNKKRKRKRAPDKGSSSKCNDTRKEPKKKNDNNIDDGPSTVNLQKMVEKSMPEGYTEASMDPSKLMDYSANLELKPDHASRPVWVASDGRIFLETFSPVYRQAYDFLVAIAEPVSRPELIHEYRLTPYALYAAVSVGLDSKSILNVLSRLCKTKLPPEIPAIVKACTRMYGKAKMVLQKGKFYVQTKDEGLYKLLIADQTINAARVPPELSEPTKVKDTNETRGSFMLAGADEALESDQAALKAITAALDDDADDIDQHDMGTVSGLDLDIFSFEVYSEQVEYVKRRCIELEYPLMEEYDFRGDTVNKSIDMDLKPIARIRPYQEKSLAKMFGNGRARSGVIVLPCGAGKSLTGVTAACTIKKPTLCLCTSSVSVEQWRYQFSLWTTLPKERIGRFTAGGKGNQIEPVTVTTYSMIAFSGKRSAETQKMLEALKATEWGLLLLDEVHVVPANVFRKVLGVVKAHTKLGLTATLLREDHKIGDINFLIGPKLYEANWLDLQRAGYLATVQCAEVWCPMTAEFYREYLTQSAAKRKLLYAMNPNKFRACQYLVRFHESRGDKVIIFSDNIFALRIYATKLQRPFIYGPTSQTERIRILYQFQHNPALGTILLSKVGDTSIDIPEANVLIQVSSHYGSRRQEAQRLGRILRPKPRAGQNFNAFFYSLVSTDTQEMYYSSKRQQFLIDQGYAFKVINELPGLDEATDLEYSTRDEQLQLLTQVLAADESEAIEIIGDVDEEMMRGRSGGGAGGGAGTARRRKIGSSALSGGAASGAKYSEFHRDSDGANSKPIDVNALMGRPVVRHTLFRKRFGGK